MNAPLFMLIAGEASGDLLAAELVRAIKAELAATPQSTAALFQQNAARVPQFIGTGGPHMLEAGVELAFDMTQHAVVGLVEVLRNYAKFKRLFHRLLDLAAARRPDVIICVDFSEFNRRFAAAIRRYQTTHPELNWNPKIIRYVSPQVWASRPKRAESMARDIDLLLTIFPFEKAWYAQRVPNLPVEFVGHPICDRFSVPRSDRGVQDSKPLVLLLPGSRLGELHRHLPVMREAARVIAAKALDPPVKFAVVLPDQTLADITSEFNWPQDTSIQVGGLASVLAQATIAIASTGTVTMECAYFGVPTVALYKTSWGTYQIGKRIVTVKYLAMPNILANELIFPEFIQHDATPENISCAVLAWLKNPAQRSAVKLKLVEVVKSLGEPGASQRAAQAVLRLLDRSKTRQLR